MCNKNLIGDLETGNDKGKFGFVAHIIAEHPNGPRGDTVLSALLKDEPKNLMLLCHPHHKLIDEDEPDNYPEQRLLDIKREHEERIGTLTAIRSKRASHVLRYGAKIGALESPVSLERVRLAMLPRRYPAGGSSIGIEIRGSAATDGEDAFWGTEPQNLQRQFNTLVRPRLADREIEHLSVFGLGPIPLLVKLGSLLGDIIPADVYQLHREPAGWVWAEDGPTLDFKVEEPTSRGSVAALKLSISGSISSERVQAVLGKDVPIWSVDCAPVGNDVMRHEGDLREFRRLMRSLYDRIKLHHGEDAKIHVFPAIPVSVAIELGRVRMPKADLPLVVYDNRPETGFVPRLEIT